MAEIYPGSTWLRHMIAGFGALMISGILRFAESLVSNAHAVGMVMLWR
jgi:hypothetical protein